MDVKRPMGKHDLDILVIDDDVDAFVLAYRFLIHDFRNVYGAASFPIAMNQVKRRHPSVILLDLGFPKQSGFQFLAWLRSEPSFERTPVIVVSAHATLHNRSLARELGATRFVAKPYSREELLSAVLAEAWSEAA